MLGGDNALGARDMRQRQPARHVANGIDAGDIGLHGFVDRDEAALVGLHAGSLQPDAVAVGRDADRNEHYVGRDRLFMPLAAPLA